MKKFVLGSTTSAMDPDHMAAEDLFQGSMHPMQLDINMVGWVSTMLTMKSPGLRCTGGAIKDHPSHHFGTLTTTDTTLTIKVRIHLIIHITELHTPLTNITKFLQDIMATEGTLASTVETGMVLGVLTSFRNHRRLGCFSQCQRTATAYQTANAMFVLKWLRSLPRLLKMWLPDTRKELRNWLKVKWAFGVYIAHTSDQGTGLSVQCVTLRQSVASTRLWQKWGRGGSNEEKRMSMSVRAECNSQYSSL